MVVDACQRFQFLRQNTMFLENNRVLSISLYGILHLLVLPSYNKISPCKTNYINHASYLSYISISVNSSSFSYAACHANARAVEISRFLLIHFFAFISKFFKYIG